MSWDVEIKKRFKYVGENVYIGKYCIFTNPSMVVLHDRVRIDSHNLITTALEVHSNSQIMSHVVISGGAAHKVTLEGSNFIGYHSELFCGSEDYSGKHGAVCDHWYENKINHGDIIFKPYSGIASSVTVMPGITFPEGCAIGAKSFVYKDSWGYVDRSLPIVERLEEWKIYAGNPLRFFKDRQKVEGKLKQKWR